MSEVEKLEASKKKMQDAFSLLEHNIASMRGRHEAIINDLKQQIDILTKENIMLKKGIKEINSYIYHNYMKDKKKEELCQL